MATRAVPIDDVAARVSARPSEQLGNDVGTLKAKEYPFGWSDVDFFGIGQMTLRAANIATMQGHLNLDEPLF